MQADIKALTNGQRRVVGAIVMFLFVLCHGVEAVFCDLSGLLRFSFCCSGVAFEILAVLRKSRWVRGGSTLFTLWRSWVLEAEQGGNGWTMDMLQPRVSRRRHKEYDFSY